MHTVATPKTAFVIVPDTNDAHDRTYRFGQPLTYLSDRQHARVLILRGRIFAARQPSAV
ncbi:MAG: hypothetical protein LC797_14745 [Chloroflexi bacterium]|nr:hypothetical protein [Chloroflexota bacterium]